MTTQQQKLIVLIHVPKTAGSTMNARLAATYGEGLTHIEGHLGKNTLTPDKINSVPWLSGHLPFDRFRALVEPKSTRPVRYLAAMRDPLLHVASHYNWLIEIGHRSPQFFEGHPEPVKEMHRIIASTDNGDPQSIIANLSRFGDMFLNCQSRYIIGSKGVGPATDYSRTLTAYDQIITPQNLKDFLTDGNRCEPPPRKNAATYHFDRSIFYHPALVAYLAEANAEDARLYDLVTKKEAGSD